MSDVKEHIKQANDSYEKAMNIVLENTLEQRKLLVQIRKIHEGGGSLNVEQQRALATMANGLLDNLQSATLVIKGYRNILMDLEKAIGGAE